MALLILGIILFLGAHSLKIVAPARATLIGGLGEKSYRGLNSVVSLIGLALIAWGFHNYRAGAWQQVWVPPAGMRHLTITLMWFAFVALAASGPKPSRIRGWLRHPMVVAVKIWALAHLLANGDLGGMILFGSFLAWAVLDRISLKYRGDFGAARISQFTRTDAVIVITGTVAYVAMMLLHPILIGVAAVG